MLADAATEADSYKTQKHDMFNDVGPDYYGDQDEADENLLAFERTAEAEGLSLFLLLSTESS